MPKGPFVLVIKRAKLRGKGSASFDLGIVDGVVASIEANIQTEALNEIDASNNLVSEAFVNTHLHLCKVWSLENFNEFLPKIN